MGCQELGEDGNTRIFHFGVFLVAKWRMILIEAICHDDGSGS
jgi:hypothetical protein